MTGLSLAQKEILRALRALPEVASRAEALVSPHTEAELEAWMQQESERRERLDQAVRQWLSAGHWPLDLDATDEWLLHVRLTAAMDWIQTAVYALLLDPDTHDTHPIDLEGLLVEGWDQDLLEKHLRHLRYQIAAYSCGREDSDHFQA